MNGEELKLLNFIHLDRKIKANLVEAKINNDELDIFIGLFFYIVQISVKSTSSALEVIPTLGPWLIGLGPKRSTSPDMGDT